MYFVNFVFLKLNRPEEIQLDEKVWEYLRLYSSNLTFTDKNTGGQLGNSLLKVTRPAAKTGLNHRFTNSTN